MTVVVGLLQIDIKFFLFFAVFSFFVLNQSCAIPGNTYLCSKEDLQRSHSARI